MPSHVPRTAPIFAPSSSATFHSIRATRLLRSTRCLPASRAHPHVRNRRDPEPRVHMHAVSLNVPPPATPELTPAHRWHRTLLYLVILVPLALGVFTFQLGVADWEDDSASCGGQIVEEMLDGQGGVLQLRNGLHIPVKPPLFYWLGALRGTGRHRGVELASVWLRSAGVGA